MTIEPIRTIEQPRDGDELGRRRREWLVTNGLGGFAAGTVAGVVTRRYHGLLVAALPAPLGRTIMLNHLLERVRLPQGGVRWLGDEDEVAGPNAVDRSEHLRAFSLEAGLPVWVYRVGPFTIEKRVLMPYGQNTVHVTYRLLEGDGSVRLTLRPSVHFRSYEAPVNASSTQRYSLSAEGTRYEMAAEGLPALRLSIHGTKPGLMLEEKGASRVPYEVEASRGYEAVGSLWSPGYFRADLAAERPVTLVGSTESWETVEALSPKQAAAAEHQRRRRLLTMAGEPASRLEAELVLAADQFIITPAGRLNEAARARAAGDDVRTVIAGYHWFTDWGRDTMISLEGLALSTGRYLEAGYILRTFGQYVRDGLIPNMFPDGSREGLYHTADATLWFFHAVDRYVRATGDVETVRVLYPKFTEIIERHLEGTRFGIGVDPRDGLLRQGEEGYQLTWMDAKVDDWVVTPRRGKAVEINALWYNALRLLDRWSHEFGLEPGTDLESHARRARASFNQRFWFADGGYLYDVVDGEGGDDHACRPNQLFAIALDHPVLDRERWPAVLDVVRERLLTPVGLRSLAPGHPDYKPRYYGDLRSRDAAYHQGTVWGWLIGPFVDAWLAVHPDDAEGARRLLDGFDAHLEEGAIGSISEIFDAEAPYTARGCVAQAWSVAEVLRCFQKARAAATGDQAKPDQREVKR
ncbi:MAG: glycogen debranching enzyme family protein [Acidobacteria bacterium]|nr:glycogen debranching enzyme family protein [Acidobacteriota bacterium]MBA3888391.1 glycogen debranching enzyme family protein [Acidobacteriota bacterium]